MSVPLVLLFDIDGTLLSSSGAGRRAMEAAFAAATGRRGLMEFPFDGMTDRAIIRRALTAATLSAEPADIDAVLAGYVARLPDQIRAARDYCVFPGVRPTLDAARAHPRTAVGLGTGNIKPGAALKLGHVGLEGYFEFGGFGCDHEERALILKTGATRGAAWLGVALGECRVVIIGDTPNDVVAARAIGAGCVGVGTGRYAPEALVAAGATFAFADLADGAALAAILG